MRNRKRRLTRAALTAIAGLLLLPAAGQAATEFGSPLKNEPSEVKCLVIGPCTIVEYTSPSGPGGSPNSEGAPFNGVITKFRYFAYAFEEPGQITFGVANVTRQDEEHALATAAGTGPTVTMQPSAEPPAINEAAARLPVKKGQHIAVNITKSIAIIYDPDGCKFSYVYAPPLVEGEGSRGSQEAACQLQVAATIEPDVDGDGFGDETQDQCPRQATTHGPCDETAPVISGLKVSGGKISYTLSEAGTVRFKLEKKLPGRRLGKRCVRQTPKNKSKKRCSRFKQIGGEFSGPGNVGPNHATLPNGKKLKPGVYRLTMTARDPAGNQSTKSITFRIKKKKRKR